MPWLLVSPGPPQTRHWQLLVLIFHEEGFAPSAPSHCQHCKSEGLHSCDRPSNLTQIGFKSWIFQPVWPWNLMNDLKKTIGHLFYNTSSFVHHFMCIISNPLVNSNCLTICSKSSDIFSDHLKKFSLIFKLICRMILSKCLTICPKSSDILSDDP